MDSDHGGNLTEARRLFPNVRSWLDLSTGVNPTSYPVPPARHDRLPQAADLERLEHLASRAFLPGESAVAGPGTGPMMALLALLSRTDEAAIVGPTYAGHARAFGAAGTRIHDVPNLAAALSTSARTIVLTRPNNPDGRVEPVVPTPDRLLIVDEAFADLEDCTGDLVARARQPGLILLRSFGKTYGLPGVRLAFALGADPLLDRLREALGAWPVSAQALAAGLAALPDSAWREAERVRLAGAAGRLDALLTRAGCAIVGGTRLFRLAAHHDAPKLWERLGRAGILVRRFAQAPDRLRFGIPPEAGFARLEAALENHALHQ